MRADGTWENIGGMK
ncbi:hypothetical protein BHI28_RS09960 [Escherichia coli]|nr:hypothetical protein [Escherichia coli]